MIDVHGAAKQLGVSKWTIWRLVRQDRIPNYNLYRGGIRFDVFELAEWKHQFRHGPKPERKKRKARK